MTVPYKAESIKDNIVIGITGDLKKEFKTDVMDGEIKQGDFFLAQNGFVVQIIPKEDADNLMKLFN